MLREWLETELNPRIQYFSAVLMPQYILYYFQKLLDRKSTERWDSEASYAVYIHMRRITLGEG